MYGTNMPNNWKPKMSVQQYAQSIIDEARKRDMGDGMNGGRAPMSLPTSGVDYKKLRAPTSLPTLDDNYKELMLQEQARKQAEMKRMIASPGQTPIQRDTYGNIVRPGDAGVRRGGPETSGWGAGDNAYRFGANNSFGKLYRIDQYGKKVYL